MLLPDVAEDDGDHVLQVPAKVLWIASLAGGLGVPQAGQVSSQLDPQPHKLPSSHTQIGTSISTTPANSGGKIILLPPSA